VLTMFAAGHEWRTDPFQFACDRVTRRLLLPMQCAPCCPFQPDAPVPLLTDASFPRAPPRVGAHRTEAPSAKTWRSGQTHERHS
jgi:hypothetical protein